MAEAVPVEDVELVQGVRMRLGRHAGEILQQRKLGHLMRHGDDDVVDGRKRLKRLREELDGARLVLKEVWYNASGMVSTGLVALRTLTPEGKTQLQPYVFIDGKESDARHAGDGIVALAAAEAIKDTEVKAVLNVVQHDLCRQRHKANGGAVELVERWSCKGEARGCVAPGGGTVGARWRGLRAPRARMLSPRPSGSRQSR